MAKWIEDQQEIEDILNRALVGRLGVIYEASPYLVPVHFVYHDNRIAFHSGLSGQKLEALQLVYLSQLLHNWWRVAGW